MIEMGTPACSSTCAVAGTSDTNANTIIYHNQPALSALARSLLLDTVVFSGGAADMQDAMGHRAAVAPDLTALLCAVS